LADLAQDLTVATGLPVIEGVGVAIRLVEGLAGAGVITSKRGVYAKPPLSNPWMPSA
jgi:allantoin racemase